MRRESDKPKPGPGVNSLILKKRSKMCSPSPEGTPRPVSVTVKIVLLSSSCVHSTMIHPYSVNFTALSMRQSNIRTMPFLSVKMVSAPLILRNNI